MTSPTSSSSGNSPLLQPQSPLNEGSSSTKRKQPSPDGASSSNAGEQPRKKRQKTHHTDPRYNRLSAPASSYNPMSIFCPESAVVSQVAQTALETTSSSPSSPDSTEEPMEEDDEQAGCSHWSSSGTYSKKHKKQYLKKRLTSHIPHPQSVPNKANWNALFISKLQKELHFFQQTLSPLDIEVMKLLKDVNKDLVIKKDPVLYVKRPLHYPNRLDWKKLGRALQRLDKYKDSAAEQPTTRVGEAAAQRSLRLLKLLYKKTTDHRKTRKFTNGAIFSRLCALSLAAQDIRLQPTTPLTDAITQVSFISGLDVATAQKNPEVIFNKQWAVSLIQDKYSMPIESWEESDTDNE